MKVDRLKFGAVIPTQQYGNIQPEIEMSDVVLEEGTDLGMSFIKNLFLKYSEKGGLKENDLVKSFVLKRSFNEGKLVGYDDSTHTYELDGKVLVSATEYIKRFYKDFDNENISAASAKSWGVDQQVVKDLWKSNGDLTSLFGKVIHAALEHYEKFKEVGEVISEKKDLEDNYCMPKHPVLRSIIDDFIVISQRNEGYVVPEALITDIEGGFCGHADRILVIDEDNMICRVQDYKVNINSEEVTSSLKPLAPFNNLPANKISKYQLQMSFYANMLQKSGWTVEGLDVFIFENEWRHYPLEVLEVIPTGK